MAVKFTYSFCHQCTVNGTVQTVTVRLVNLAENENVSSSLFSASLSECDLNVCILQT